MDFRKDAVDKKTKAVDGKEVTEYTMLMGNVIQIGRMVRKFRRWIRIWLKLNELKRV